VKEERGDRGEERRGEERMRTRRREECAPTYLSHNTYCTYIYIHIDIYMYILIDIGRHIHREHPYVPPLCCMYPYV